MNENLGRSQAGSKFIANTILPSFEEIREKFEIENNGLKYFLDGVETSLTETKEKVQISKNESSKLAKKKTGTQTNRQ